MPPEPWPELSEPFELRDASWLVRQLTEEPGGALLVPVVNPEALRRRFDDTLGVAGWSFQLLAASGGAIICNLTLAGVTRAAVAANPAGLDVGTERLADHALCLAAAAFGIGPSLADRFSAVVDFDDETGAPLYLPADDLWLAAMAAASSAAAASVGARDVAGDPSESAATAPSAEVAVTAEGAPAAKGAPERSQGAKAIDRLVERLSEEGLGREAARLVVAHHGYGRDPDEGRELYSKLRALLLEKHGVDN